MTYFGVLARFILPPLLILILLVPRDLWRRLFLRTGQVYKQAYWVLFAHVLIALFYTTPWDNYLVAKGVWWYDPNLVTGITLGWVPLEEYTFFVLQTMMTGFWVLGLRASFSKSTPAFTPNERLRLWGSVAISLLWIASGLILLFGWVPGNYLALILIWALPPVLLQVAFGADILLANGRLLLAAILPTTMYLWLVDAIAIRSGTWTIDPRQTTGIALGVLPIEEMLFFLMTNLIIAFGITLMLSPASKSRLDSWLESLRIRLPSARGLFQTLTMAAWLLTLTATPIAVWIWGPQVFAPMAILGVVMHVVATLTALSLRWSWSRLLRLAAIVVVYTWLVEMVGSATGFPFGRYSYTGALGLQLGAVPLVIPLAWLMMLPPAWAVADAILAPLKSRLGNWRRLAFALLSGLAFTAWDLFLDPQMVGHGLWVWENPGGFFGIPWSNYLGWVGVSTLLTWLVQPAQLERRRLLMIYSLTWIFQTIGLGLFWGQPGPALAGFLVMGFFVLWAWTREAREWKFSSGLRWGTSAVRSRSQSS